jgi:Death domain
MPGFQGNSRSRWRIPGNDQRQLSEREIEALKAHTGERNAEAALKAWVARANPERTVAKLRAALKDSLQEEAAGKGKSFRTSREAIRWLES